MRLERMSLLLVLVFVMTAIPRAAMDTNTQRPTVPLSKTGEQTRLLANRFDGGALDGRVKRCPTCAGAFRLDLFHRNRCTKDGRDWECAACANRRVREWTAAHGRRGLPLQTGTKRCAICKSVKHITLFATNRTHTDGRTYQCRKCLSAVQRQWRRVNPDRARAQKRRHYIRYREHYRWVQILKKYNLTSAEYARILRKQGGGCAICGCGPTPPRRYLDVDHDHFSGRVRGLLCSRHNHGIAKFNDMPHELIAAARYISSHLKRQVRAGDSPSRVKKIQGGSR